MARPNVTVIVNDQSFVISGTESGGAHRAGFIGATLGEAVGNTTERQQGFMVIEGTDDWFARLQTSDPVGTVQGTTTNGDAPFMHDGGTLGIMNTGGTAFAGATFARWPNGPTGSWEAHWWSVHNYLLYGGVCVVGFAGSVSNTTSGTDTLKNKSLALDSVFGYSGDNNNVSAIVSARGDCVGVEHIPFGETALAAAKSTSSENMITVFGDKTHVDISRLSSAVVTDSNLITTPLSSDVAGCLARTDRVSNPWFSPGGAIRGRILDVVRLAKDLSDSDQDTLYDKGINAVVVFPGEGTMLFGDKTNKASTSTLSRINVARLFLYLTKVIGTSARSLLFEQNDDITRNLFINAVTPVLETIRGQRGITDFRVICDTTNNTADVVDSNQFVADIFIKPTKSINFIRLRFTNASEGVELG